MTKSLNLIIFIIINFSIINLLINSLYSNYKIIHPIIIGSILLIFNLITTINISLFYNDNWFSFIAFLIIIGGIIILFLYFTRFIININTTLKINFFININIKIILILIILLFLLFFMKKNLIWYNNFNEIQSIYNLLNLNSLNKNFYVIYIYIYNKNLISIICILYLLLSLTLIVKIIFLNKFTLRKIN